MTLGANTYLHTAQDQERRESKRQWTAQVMDSDHGSGSAYQRSPGSPAALPPCLSPAPDDKPGPQRCAEAPYAASLSPVAACNGHNHALPGPRAVTTGIPSQVELVHSLHGHKSSQHDNARRHGHASSHLQYTGNELNSSSSTVSSWANGGGESMDGANAHAHNSRTISTAVGGSLSGSKRSAMPSTGSEQLASDEHNKQPTRARGSNTAYPPPPTQHGATSMGVQHTPVGPGPGHSAKRRALLSFSDELLDEGGDVRISLQPQGQQQHEGADAVAGSVSAQGVDGRRGSGGIGSVTALRFKQEMKQAPLVLPSRVVTSAENWLTASIQRAVVPASAGNGSHWRQNPSLPGLGMSFAPLEAQGKDQTQPDATLNGAAAGSGTGFGVRRAGHSPTRSDDDADRSTGFACELSRIVFGVSTCRCARPYMEDRHVIIHSLAPLGSSGAPLHDGVPRALAAIFDGHNGVRSAELATSRMHQLIAADPALRTYTGQRGPPASVVAEEAAIGGALKRAFRTLDDQLLAEARTDGLRDGATALVVLRLGDAMYSAHAGDSRAVMSRGGVALRLTEDHKPNLPAERSRVEAAGGRVDFQRCWRVIVAPREGRLGSGLAVSRSLGDLDFKEPSRFVECEPDVNRYVPSPEDNLIVMASDGLWDVLSDQEAVDCANEALRAARATGGSSALAALGTGVIAPLTDAHAKAVADALLGAAVKRGTADNVTVVAMLLEYN